MIKNDPNIASIAVVKIKNFKKKNLKIKNVIKNRDTTQRLKTMKKFLFNFI